MIQRVCALHGHGDHITFDTAFASPPVIVTSAQYGGVTKIACVPWVIPKGQEKHHPGRNSLK